MFRRSFTLLALVGLVSGLAPSSGPKLGVDRALAAPTSDNVVGKPNVRRSCFGVIASSLSVALLPDPQARAFDNKISNKYDDRPKRRGPKPKDLGLSPRTSMSGDAYVGLKECGAAPNCFSSTMIKDDDPDHWIPAWIWPESFGNDKSKAFQDLYEVLKSYPPGQNNVDGGGFQFQTVDTKDGYIYVVYEALKNGYYDDVEFAYLDGTGDRTVQVRSSSRIGYLDFGVNAKRLNWIAKQLRTRGWTAEGVDFNTHQGYADENGLTVTSSRLVSMLSAVRTSLATTVVATGLSLAALTQAPATTLAATDPGAIVGCLLQKCPLPLAECIANPKCLANVICINTCNGRPDEIDCQIECGNLWENDVVGKFNKCAVSDMSCVPQQGDDGSYPVPPDNVVVKDFSTKLWRGRWYITAGQNKLFDIFPCQVHFFEETRDGEFFGKLNWRIEEPDGEFFTRDALQSFVQDPKQPGHLINHDNEYLHYKDDWWIIDYEYDDNKDGVPPFAFVYYRGSNDAWDGYGGAVVYTRAAALPESLIPRLRAAAQKVGFDFDKDFTVTDNSCPSELSESEKLLLREKFAGKAIIQTSKQLQAEATRSRGNAVNSIKAQKLFFGSRAEDALNAFERLNQQAATFEKEATK